MNSCTQKKPVRLEQPERSCAHKSVFLCRGLGMDCSFEATGATRTEVMRKFIDHAGSAHNMDVLTADVLYRVHKAIHK
jgi:predicted small metal-binding protein